MDEPTNAHDAKIESATPPVRNVDLGPQRRRGVLVGSAAMTALIAMNIQLNKKPLHVPMPKGIENESDNDRLRAAEEKRQRKAAKRQRTVTHEVDGDTVSHEDWLHLRKFFVRDCSCHQTPPCKNCMMHADLFPEAY
jgi:hypothetical protein